ncbi:MAG TPA: PH domain-containing protein, partial [Rubrobacteraceae bacterium]|nr:PH domain-containing protein [Rubrobacteraceae bacterium]
MNSETPVNPEPENPEPENPEPESPEPESPEPRRLHPVGMLIDAVKTVRQWISALVIPGIAFLASQGFGGRTLALVLIGFVVVAVLAAGWGFLRWRATTYGVYGGAFHLRQGVIQKTERTIPLEHVQSVDTVQGIIQRVFGVVEVRIETAGGGGDAPDASLSALGMEEAEALRREIKGSRGAGSLTAADTGEAAEDGPAVIRALSTRDLLVAGATSGQIGVALSVVAVASQVFDDVFSNSFAERIITSLAPRSVTAALLLVLVVGLFAWLLAIAGTVLSYANFTLSRDGEFLYIRRGLLEKREATIPLARIQALKVVEGVLRQPFGLAMVRVESAGYGKDAGVSTTLFPLLPRAEAQDLLRRAAPEFAAEPPLEKLPRRALRRYVFRAVLPVLFLVSILATVSVLALDFIPGAFLALLLLVPAVFLGWLRYRDA